MNCSLMLANNIISRMGVKNFTVHVLLQHSYRIMSSQVSFIDQDDTGPAVISY